MWELKAILELKPGDMLLFADHLLTHSNTEVHGIRHSLMAFTHECVIQWLTKEMGRGTRETIMRLKEGCAKFLKETERQKKGEK